MLLAPMGFQFPDADRAIIKSLFSPPFSRLDGLLDALESATPSLTPRGLAEQLGSEAGSPESARAIGVLINISRTLAEVKPQQRIELRNDLFAVTIEDDSSHDRAPFDLRIERVRGLRALELSGKAFLLMQEHARRLVACKLISDIRPVFRDENVVPDGCVVAHQLKLLYEIGPEGETREDFLALDLADIRMMQEVLTRALRKHDELVKTARKAGLTVIGDGQE